MFSRKQKIYLAVFVLALCSGASRSYAADAIATVNEANLPINVSEKTVNSANVANPDAKAALVSPSKAKSSAPIAAAADTPQGNAQAVLAPSAPQAEPQAGNAQVQAAVPATLPAPAPITDSTLPAASPAPVAGGTLPAAVPPTQVQAQAATAQASAAAPAKPDDFNFDLKMKSINAPDGQQEKGKKDGESPKSSVADVDLPKDIQYTANPVEALGNSVLTQMDSDLFSQMSEIEKSTTLLTLELRREKIRNEIEAQKAIRQKNIDDLAREKEERRLQTLEKEKQIEAQVLKEKQALLDKEQLFEVLKQRKLLNAYMNQMLVNQQEWLKEKENLYAQIAAVELEKKELIELFKQRINKVLEASAKNIQVAEAAKANFERIVKNLKARNEQLRKRVAADAQIIKNAKNSLYLKSQSIEELKGKNAAVAAMISAQEAKDAELNAENIDEEIEEEEAPATLSSQFALLGISGRGGDMNVEVMDLNGQPLSLKIGSPLPSGHILSEIGADYAKFSRDGTDEYLYIGRSFDGYVPTLEEDTKK